jgi:hypothetical protein
MVASYIRLMQTVLDTHFVEFCEISSGVFIPGLVMELPSHGDW